MSTGRIVRFDWKNGYGFIVPDDGGEDVFLHASEIPEEQRELVRTGAPVTFLAMRSSRGVKAAEVRIVEDAAEGTAGHDGYQDEGWSDGGARGGGSSEDDDGYDAYTEAEFTQQVTELLLHAAPSLTGAQIIEARRGLVAFAHDRGWLDE